ncbi:MAG TPA: shikimate kinase [Bacteroidia bacterium]|nr:shikimate kinase [Bacteroidia bacterium]
MVIFLVGFMGAGKSVIGSLVAEKTGFEFIDIDFLIEFNSKKTISELFTTKGEAYFRNLETETLHQLAGKENCVIATGGGLPCFNNNMEWMNRHGITVYIKQDVEELVRRLEKNAENRPVLKQAKNESLFQYISALLKKRALFYNQSKHILKGPLISPETVINTVFS